ncbi:hypothetical protein CTA1_5246 [Colletotrichum tanaceti]|uniref:Uncharacterized protein n=1 Tax=Colletotrichum tanaceti TaxID=1306861 RepID=A0A4U6XRF4_9PEZI|nr:hypothetical protein CTA1_5246 [Colletotrichum tanaceti]
MQYASPRTTRMLLRKQEITKTRQIYTASGSIGAGVSGAAVTAGATLAVAAYGTRRYYVANNMDYV